MKIKNNGMISMYILTLVVVHNTGSGTYLLQNLDPTSGS